MSFFWSVCISANLVCAAHRFIRSAPRGVRRGCSDLRLWLDAGFFFTLIGSMVDQFGFTAVCVVMSMLPLVGVGILQVTTK